MINSNELRIGNYVACENILQTVKGIMTLGVSDLYTSEALIDVKNINGFFDTFEVEQLEPIPLTEEWLLKLPKPMKIPEWIEFVHQLQNWYWVENKCKKELEFID